MTTILTSYYRPKPGGFCRRYFRAIEALCKRGHAVHYLSVEPFPVPHSSARWHRFPWPRRYTNNYLFWLVFHLLAPLMLLAVAWRVRADRLFAFSPTYGLLLQLARRLLSLPLVVFIRADSLENHRLLGRPNWLIAVERRLERIGLKCEAIYCVSRSLCDVLRERHGAYLPLKVLPNDIPAGVVREKTYSNILRMAMVGVIEPRKGQVFLLHALSELGGLHWRIDVYGDGPDRDEAECIVRQYGLEDKVHFHGWVSREQLWSCTDLLLFPSRHEGAPNAVLESLAAQVPVLGSDIAEMREVLPLPDLIDATSADEWLARVALLLRNRDVLGEMSERQSRYAATYRFDWDDSVVRAIVGSET